MVNVSEKLIDRMTQRIVQEVDPERVVLFGSWARGEAREWSDVDLLVVERATLRPGPKSLKAWLALKRIEYPRTHDLNPLLGPLEDQDEDVAPFWPSLELNPFAVQLRIARAAIGVDCRAT